MSGDAGPGARRDAGGGAGPGAPRQGAPRRTGRGTIRDAVRGTSLGARFGVGRSATAARTPFVVLVVTLLAGGLISLLLLNAAVNRDSFKLDKLQDDTTKYTDQQQQLQQEVDGYSAPGSLEQRARGLGMVPGGDPAFLGPNGKVAGSPSPATAPPAPPPPPPTTAPVTPTAPTVPLVTPPATGTGTGTTAGTGAAGTTADTSTPNAATGGTQANPNSTANSTVNGTSNSAGSATGTQHTQHTPTAPTTGR